MRDQIESTIAAAEKLALQPNVKNNIRAILESVDAGWDEDALHPLVLDNPGSALDTKALLTEALAAIQKKQNTVFPELEIRMLSGMCAELSCECADRSVSILVQSMPAAAYVKKSPAGTCEGCSTADDRICWHRLIRWVACGSKKWTA